jgi:hypothetical protein
MELIVYTYHNLIDQSKEDLANMFCIPIISRYPDGEDLESESV